mmetsp:Transcript_43645/g.98679  ORF Transcript_43645/g.98679 Transcript_43645/m.98679 type:complete len:206 (-) Transcript_43645:7-624(-)
MNRFQYSVLLLLGHHAAPNITQATFFVTSKNPGQGGNLGGLEGADVYCAQLAESVANTGNNWRAYLSSSLEDARDRIGVGPWFNAQGVMIAASIDTLHSEENNISKETALDEFGMVISGNGDEVNRHDIITGSNIDGRLAAGETCNDWTTDEGGSAMVGHHDRTGSDRASSPTSWNAAHSSLGCSLEDFAQTGGDGLFYCFAHGT